MKLVSRNQKDLTRDYPTIAAAVAALPTPSLQLDGEIVALDASGRPSFQALQHRSTKGLTLVFEFVVQFFKRFDWSFYVDRQCRTGSDIQP